MCFCMWGEWHTPSAVGGKVCRYEKRKEGCACCGESRKNCNKNNADSDCRRQTQLAVVIECRLGAKGCWVATRKDLRPDRRTAGRHLLMKTSQLSQLTDNPYVCTYICYCCCCCYFGFCYYYYFFCCCHLCGRA